MDTLGPVSVLDSGRRHREALVADRLTRRRCQDRGPRLKAAHSDLDVVYRIPQPYRTSFSAKHSVERLPGSDRSRSLSPASSLRSVQSSRSERVGGLRYPHTYSHHHHRQRAKSPKRVTYDTRVTVRHSDAEDSMFTELSSRGGDLDPSSHSTPSSISPSSFSRGGPHLRSSPTSPLSPSSSSSSPSSVPHLHAHTPNTSSSTPSSSVNHMSRDSGLDYSTQLRDLSDQIIKMDWSTSSSHKERGGPSQHTGPQGILKESQNSHKPHHPPPSSPSTSSPPTTTATPRQDKENAPNGSPPPPPPGQPHKDGGVGARPRGSLDTALSREYQQERVFSYKEAVSGGYGPEVRALVEGGGSGGGALGDLSPASPDGDRGRENGSLLAQQRSSSVSAVSKASLSTAPPSSSQLTPAKRSVSSSISNFFRRISPRLGRRPAPSSKDRSSNNGSRAGSSQSLPASAGVTVMDPHPASTAQAHTNASSGGGGGGAAPTPTSSSSHSGHFSRSRIRNSFLKLMGGGRKDSKSKVTAAISSASTPSPQSQPSPPLHPASQGGEGGPQLDTSRESEASCDTRGSSGAGGGTPSEGQGTRPLPESTQRRLKTMETNDPGKKDVYREFKDRCSPRSPTGATPTATPVGGSSAEANDKLEERYRAIKAQYKDRPHPLDDEFSFDVFDSSASPPPPPSSSSGAGVTSKSQHPPHTSFSSSSPEVEDRGGGVGGGSKAEPPSSLDVVPPRAIRLLQASTISTISGDESIGECSLDCNLTASQPSLLSGTSHQSTGSGLSKKAVLNQSLLSSSTDSQQLPPDPTPPPHTHTDPADPTSPNNTTAPIPRPRRQKDALVLGQELIDTSSPSAPGGDLGGDLQCGLSPLSPLSPGGADPSRKPSYLKLSCAVSGYGRYSRYSSYRTIPTRSPFSSTSSLRSDLSSPDPSMPSSSCPLRSPSSAVDDPPRRESGGGGRSLGGSPVAATPTSIMAAAAAAADLSNGKSPSSSTCLSPSAVNGHSSSATAAAAAAPNSAQKAGDYPTGDRVKDGQYFLDIMKSEEDRLNQQSKRAEGLMRSQALPEEVNGRIRAAIGKSNLLISQKFKQFKELCDQHMDPDPEEQTLLFEDLQGFWALIKIQVDNVDDSFAEIVTMSQNGWKEIPKLVPSRRSSTSSSPKSGSLSQTSTPSATPGHTPGSRRRGLKTNSTKDTPDSSPEHAEKMRSAAKARDEARKRMLAEKRAAMKQQQQQQQQQQQGTTPEVEIFLPDGTKK